MDGYRRALPLHKVRIAAAIVAPGLSNRRSWSLVDVRGGRGPVVKKNASPIPASAAVFSGLRLLAGRDWIGTAIVIEPAPGLPAEPTRFHILHQQRAGAVFTVGKAFIQDLHD